MGNESDYRWFVDEFYHYWINGFCLTFIADRSATLVKDALQSTVGGTSSIEIEDPDQLFAASVHDAGNGSIVLERGGYAGYTARIASVLSRNTRVAVVIYFLVGSPKFAFVENGTLVCGFNISDPESRRGKSPDLLLSNLIATGLLPVDDPEWETEKEELEALEMSGGEEGDRVLQAISIAAQLTGVPFDRRLRENPRYFVSLADFHLSNDASTTRFIK